MAKDARSTYEVTINGMKHAVLLDPEAAENYGPAAKKIEEPTVAQADDDQAAGDDLIDPETTAKTSRRR